MDDRCGICHAFCAPREQIPNAVTSAPIPSFPMILRCTRIPIPKRANRRLRLAPVQIANRQPDSLGQRPCDRPASQITPFPISSPNSTFQSPQIDHPPKEPPIFWPSASLRAKKAFLWPAPAPLNRPPLQWVPCAAALRMRRWTANVLAGTTDDPFLWPPVGAFSNSQIEC